MAGSVVSAQALDPHEGDGINSREQLAAAAATMQQRINIAHMRAGVTLIDPRNTYIGPMVKISRDVEIWPGVHILGQSEIKGHVRIMPGSFIKDCTIGPESTIGQHCFIEGAKISPGAAIAPLTVLAI
jgi:bifunctional UDP-N-acetylglucosamine pyrophosphorylase/glucosamine-1-phosphate N-acetyltransferase